jgi:hypothetical protein
MQFFRPPVISSTLDPHVLLSTSFSNLSFGHTQNEMNSPDTNSAENFVQLGAKIILVDKLR